MVQLLSTWRTWFEGQPQSEPAGQIIGKRENRKKGEWEVRKHYENLTHSMNLEVSCKSGLIVANIIKWKSYLVFEYIHNPEVDDPQETHAELSENEALLLRRQDVHEKPTHLPVTSCKNE